MKLLTFEFICQISRENWENPMIGKDLFNFSSSLGDLLIDRMT